MSGVVRVAAATVGQRTALLGCEHRYPSRVFPSTPPDAAAAGAAGVIISGHGGGLLGGDTHNINVEVGENASLLLSSQSATKVLPTRPASNHRHTRTNTKLKVAPGGLLVSALDCIVPFRKSALLASLDVELASADASAVVVDAVSAGRIAHGERWELTSLKQRSKYWLGFDDNREQILELASQLGTGDAQRILDFGASHDAFASIVAVGPRASPVVDQALSMQQANFDQNGGPRQRRGSHVDVPQICLSVSSHDEAPDGTLLPTTVIKVATRKVEELYCTLQELLSPLASPLGVQPYGSHGLFHAVPTTPDTRSSLSEKSLSEAVETVHAASHSDDALPDLSPLAAWRLMQLTDATLPTGGFAHSAGLEAAAQFGYLPNESAVHDFVIASMQHGKSLLLPFVAAGHRLHADFSSMTSEEHTEHSGTLAFADADRSLDLHLRANPVALAASHEQGASLLRLLGPWTTDEDSDRSFDHLRHGPGNIAPIFGAAAQSLGVPLPETVQAFQYTFARDIVASAVRMNLIGPSHGVRILDQVVQHSSLESQRLEHAPIEDLIAEAASCDALIDPIQANHGKLFSRLFRS